MSSNSIRIGSDLFAEAQEQGELMSRSAAQQVEHWAKLGVAVEATGLSVAEVTLLLRRGIEPSTKVQPVPEKELWAYKRANQARDLDLVRSGAATNQQMNWFSGGKANAVKIVGLPY